MSQLIESHERSTAALRKRMRTLESETLTLLAVLHGVAKVLGAGPLKKKRLAIRAARGATRKYKWTAEEDAQLKKLFPEIGAAASAIRLGRSENGVRIHARKLGLNTLRRSRPQLEMNAT